MDKKECTTYGCTKKCEPCRVKFRDEEIKRSLIHRLNRIEGQIRGINGMVAGNVFCGDIITQVMAAQAALNAFNREILTEHMKTCVMEDLRSGDKTSLNDIIKTFKKLMK